MSGNIWNQEEYALKARQAAAEGFVLLKNENKALPLHDGEKIAIFGRNQFNYYKSGTGSGGAVNVDYVVGIYEAMKQSGRYEINAFVRRTYEAFIKEHPFNGGKGWADEPWFQKEMPLSQIISNDDLTPQSLVDIAVKESDVAIILIGRTAGEDQDNKNEPGSFLLTEEERDMLSRVCSAFSRTIVLLNVGNIIDMRWVEEYKPSAVAYVWQGGQEGGNGVLDVLSGDVCPSGRLSDTIARCIEDYPSTANFGNETDNIHSEDIYVGYRYFETFAKDKVVYPFGFGLSYTSFKMDVIGFAAADMKVLVEVKVTNIGTVAGKQVVQVYGAAPQGVLGKPARVLCGFAKTKTLGENASETVSIEIPFYNLASYDDSGVTGYRSCYVMEEGEYHIFVGEDVRSAGQIGSFVQKETIVISECKEALAPISQFLRMKPKALREAQGYEIAYEEVPVQTVTPQHKRNMALPADVSYTGDKGLKLLDVAEDKASMEEFIGQLSDEDLCALIRGEGMSSPKVTPGIAGAFGGVTKRLLSFGIPIAGCADGPSGIRMDCGIHAFSMPNGTCLACSFNEKLSEELYQWEGLELRKNRIDTLLGPGMNIHRNPLNGRNFEYFSEDPFLTGKMAAAQLHGMHANHKQTDTKHKSQVTGTIKHFACNTQEYKRNRVNAVISERAAREIYLKGFEIAIKEGHARSIMSTYGPINGIWTASSYELLTEILRNEWGFDGIVMTDWWAAGNDYAGGAASLKNVASQVRAQNDLNMVNVNAGENSNQDNLMEALKTGNLTRGELCRSAANICRFLINTPSFCHMLGIESELDKELKAACSNEDTALQNMEVLDVNQAMTWLDVSQIDTGKGKTTIINITLKTRGVYQLELTLKAVERNELAQLPITVYKDREVIKTITLKGTDVDWRTEEVVLTPCYRHNFYLKLFFAQSGIEIKEAKLVFVTDLEERIQKHLETH